MITPDQVKSLREKTDASIMACKRALESADGDMAKALKLLEEEGVKIANKKADRSTAIGLVEAYVHTNQRVAALVELKCETDFVARNPEFKMLAHDIAMHVVAASPESPEGLLEQPFIKNESKTIGELITDAIARFGENITLGRFVRFEI